MRSKSRRRGIALASLLLAALGACLVFLAGGVRGPMVFVGPPSQISEERDIRAQLDWRPPPRLAGESLTAALRDPADPEASELMPVEDLGLIVDCRSRQRCPAGATCWLGDSGRLGCYRSNCSSAIQAPEECGPGKTCEIVDRVRGVRRCVDSGSVPEGAVCRRSEHADPASSCAQGLSCLRSRCRRLCRGDGDCPRAACLRGSDGDGTCVPTCASEQDCMPGYSCVTMSSSPLRRCVLVLKPPPGETSCTADSTCTAGRRCESGLFEDVLVSMCKPACDAATPCAGGMACAKISGGPHGVCVTICDPTDPTACEAPARCVSLDEASGQWGCRTGSYSERPGVHLTRARGNFSDPVADPI